MSWNDILGFLIVLFIFLLPLLSKLFSGKGQKKETHPRIEEVIEEEENAEEPSPFILPTPMVPRTEEERYEFHSRFEPKKKKKKHLKRGTDPLSVALKGRSQLQAMMLASQILGESKSVNEP